MGTQPGQEAPSSPPLLLRAYAASPSSSPSGSDSSTGANDVSESSDEDDIRDRLKSLLPLAPRTALEQFDPSVTTIGPELDTGVADKLSMLPACVGREDADDSCNRDAQAPFASPATSIPHASLHSSPPSRSPGDLEWLEDGIMAASILGLTAPVRGDTSGGR